MKKLLLIIALFISSFVYSQGVAINTDGSNPDASSILDVKSTDKGIIIPRVSIPNLSNAAPITSPVESLLVYNTNTTTGVGYHYWNGTTWIKIVTNKYLNDNVFTVESTSTITVINTWSTIPGETITVNGLKNGDRVMISFFGNMLGSSSNGDANIDVALFINNVLAVVGGYVRTTVSKDEWENYGGISRYLVITDGNYTFDIRAIRMSGTQTVQIGGNSSSALEGVLIVQVIKY